MGRWPKRRYAIRRCRLLVRASRCCTAGQKNACGPSKLRQLLRHSCSRVGACPSTSAMAELQRRKPSTRCVCWPINPMGLMRRRGWPLGLTLLMHRDIGPRKKSDDTSRAVLTFVVRRTAPARCISCTAKSLAHRLRHVLVAAAKPLAMAPPRFGHSYVSPTLRCLLAHRAGAAGGLGGYRNAFGVPPRFARNGASKRCHRRLHRRRRARDPNVNMKLARSASEEWGNTFGHATTFKVFPIEFLDESLRGRRRDLGKQNRRQQRLGFDCD